MCHLDTLRVGVRHQNVPLLSDGHALWVGELSPAPPPVSVATYLQSNIYCLPVAYCQHEVLVQEVAGGAQGVVGVGTHGPGVARGGPPAPHPAAGRVDSRAGKKPCFAVTGGRRPQLTTRAFSLLKAHASTFKLQNLLRHYAK